MTFSPEPPRPPNPRRPSRPFSTLDVDPIAQEAMRAIPSLQNFALDAGYPHEYHWEIKGDTPEAGGERRLAQVHVHEGWRILSKSILRDI